MTSTNHLLSRKNLLRVSVCLSAPFLSNCKGMECKDKLQIGCSSCIIWRPTHLARTIQLSRGQEVSNKASSQTSWKIRTQLRGQQQFHHQPAIPEATPFSSFLFLLPLVNLLLADGFLCFHSKPLMTEVIYCLIVSAYCLLSTSLGFCDNLGLLLIISLLFSIFGSRHSNCPRERL